MLKRFLASFILCGSVLLAASCTTRTEPKEDPPAVAEAPALPAKPDPREVTLHVDGMSERLKLI